MLLSLFLTCFACLAITTVLLLVAGHRVRVSSRALGVLCALVLVVGSGELTARLWRLPVAYVEAGELLLLSCIITTVRLRPRWNPLGQSFFGSYVASAIVYLAFAAQITFAGGLSPVAELASAVLMLLELTALLLAASFAFESLDVLTRTRWERPIPRPDPRYVPPKVSLHIAAYNEPPNMLIETIRSVEAIDYPSFEVVVIDNNTKDPDVWTPVERYCRDRPRVRFVHVDPWPGYKSSALNLALSSYTDPDAES
jgi:hypothetical protein